MNICAKSCKHYEFCISLRYNNCRQPYMTEVEVIETRDSFPVIYVKKCARFQKTNNFIKTLRGGIENERHPQNKKMARKKKDNIKKR